MIHDNRNAVLRRRLNSWGPFLILFGFTLFYGIGHGESKKGEEKNKPSYVNDRYASRINILVAGIFYDYQEKSGSYVYAVDLESGDLVPLLYIKDYRIGVCAIDENSRYILVGGYYYGDLSSAVIVFDLARKGENGEPLRITEERFSAGSYITSVYDSRERSFFIATAEPVGVGIPGGKEAFYGKTGKTGDTIIFKYVPPSEELTSLSELPVYLKIGGVAVDEKKLYVIYEEYPDAFRLGYFDNENGSVSYMYSLPSNRFLFFYDTESIKKPVPNRPISYYCIPAFTGKSQDMVVYVHYRVQSGGDSIKKLGDAIRLPVLFSTERGEIIYVISYNGEAVLESFSVTEGVTNTIRFGEDLGADFKLLSVN